MREREDITSHLQEIGEFCMLDVEGDVEGRLVELAERVDVGSVFEEYLSNVVVSVLSGPVQRRHLQHVFSVHVRAVLTTYITPTYTYITPTYTYSREIYCLKTSGANHAHPRGTSQTD